MSDKYEIYGEDFAKIYHLNFSQSSRAIAKALLNIIKRYELEAVHIVDLGCGEGTAAKMLIEAGYEVSGCDISPHMLAIAHEQVPDAQLILASSFEYKMPQCDIIVGIGGALSHNPNRWNQLEHLTQLEYFFERAHRALSPGGLLIFDLPTMNTLPSHDRLRAGQHYENWSYMQDVTIDLEHCEAQRHITVATRIDDGALFRLSREKHRLTLFETWQITDKLHPVGFVTTESSRIEEYKMLTGHQLFWARKPIEENYT
ncbi:MAG: class I SAM-dependent methyltransferase [Armatimonadetes bacterium]|nr:class I SAM-dependent methyltransferase [Armatimonadota bacterium]